MRFVFTLLVAAVTVACGLVRSYSVEPKSAALSGWTDTIRPYNYVSQVLTINFDEPITASLFCGSPGAGSGYEVSIRTYPGDIEIAHGDTISPGDHKWATCTLQVDDPDSFIKGRRVEFRWTRSGVDSIHYYYDTACGYGPYGQMIAPYPPFISPSTGLAMRCYGRMRPVSDVWRACVNHWRDPRPDSGYGGLTALAEAESMGITWIREDFGTWPMWYYWPAGPMSAYDRYVDSLDDSVIGILARCPETLSTYSRWDPTDTGAVRELHPPQNLDSAVTDTLNFWAAYCRGIMNSMPRVKYWEVWPEGNAWYWADPDTHYYKDPSGGPIDTARERCSLYVRMCQIAESIADTLGAGRKVVAGGVWRLTDVPSGVGGAQTDVAWLSDMFDLAEHSYGGVENCFDVVSTHPYMDYPGNGRFYFIEDVFDTCLDTARDVMRAAGYPGKELWATEYGWPRYKQDQPDSLLTDTLTQADNVCKFYTSAIARQADPRGGYDRAIHYELTGFHATGGDNQGFGFLESDTGQHRLPHSWAFAQESILTGKRCNGRVLVGGLKDDSVRIYEFEDTATLRKTWVCWENILSLLPSPTIAIKLPARSDTAHAVDLDYGDNPMPSDPAALSSGWLPCTLTTRPAFVTEPSDKSISRPDLVVDSVKYVLRLPDTVRAWVTNRGNRATPHQSAGGVPYPTWAVLYANGDSLAQQVTFRFNLSVAQPTPVLFAVKANPAQTYVELGTDDNSGYRLKAQP